MDTNESYEVYLYAIVVRCLSKQKSVKERFKNGITKLERNGLQRGKTNDKSEE